MKKINKKIGAVALAGTLVAGVGLSQVPVSYASSNSVPKILIGSNLLKNPPQGSAYNYVEYNQSRSNYTAIHLGYGAEFNKFIKQVPLKKNNNKDMLITVKHFRHERIPNYFYLDNNNRYFYLDFVDGAEFAKNLDKLDRYRTQKRPIVVKIGNDYFGFFFSLTSNQQNVLPIYQLAKSYGFNVHYAHSSNNSYGKATINSHISNILKAYKNVNKKQLEEPKISGQNVFNNGDEFASALKTEAINIPSGFSRYRIGTYDFILQK